MTLPFVPNDFIAGFVTDDIGGLRGEGWRRGVSDASLSSLATGPSLY
jgi:hypothetical protein